MQKIIIAAKDRNSAIGKNGSMPWHLRGDLLHFKEVTSGSPVIMGRRTFESLGKPLPGRLNIVITSAPAENFPGATVVKNLDEAFSVAEKSPCTKCFIIGGGMLYKESIALADELIMTEIEAEAEAPDTYFPEIDKTVWFDSCSSKLQQGEKDDFPYRFVTYRRRHGIDDCGIIQLPKFSDPRGNLSFAENYAQLPFEIKRTYWIYDVPSGEMRGGHAFRRNEEVIVALSGSFTVTVKDGENEKMFTLSRPCEGLYIPAGLWRSIEHFSTNSLALEFSSTYYDGNDYVLDMDEYKKLKEDGEI